MSKFKADLLQGHQGDGIINTWKDLLTVRGWWWSLTFSHGIYTICKGFKDCQDTMTWNHRLCWKAKPGQKYVLQTSDKDLRTLRLLDLWYLIRVGGASLCVSSLPYHTTPATRERWATLLLISEEQQIILVKNIKQKKNGQFLIHICPWHTSMFLKGQFSQKLY